jgi:hypothetical protein
MLAADPSLWDIHTGAVSPQGPPLPSSTACNYGLLRQWGLVLPACIF